MVSTRFSILLVAATSALALQGHTDAAPCDADNYSKVASAVQTLHANCASWAAYLASGGVWTCDSTCRDAVVNLVDTLPDCTFGGPYGQNYKQVVEGMVATCSGAISSGSDSTAAPSSTTAAPTTDSSSSNNNNSTESAAMTKAPAPTATTSTDIKVSSATNTNVSGSASGSAGATDTPASDVSTTSGASSQAVSAIAALVLVVVGSLLH